MSSQRTSRRLKNQPPTSPITERKRVPKPSKRALEASLPLTATKQRPKKRARKARPVIPQVLLSLSSNIEEPFKSLENSPKKELLTIINSLSLTSLV